MDTLGSTNGGEDFILCIDHPAKLYFNVYLLVVTSSSRIVIAGATGARLLDHYYYYIIVAFILVFPVLLTTLSLKTYFVIDRGFWEGGLGGS